MFEPRAFVVAIVAREIVLVEPARVSRAAAAAPPAPAPAGSSRPLPVVPQRRPSPSSSSSSGRGAPSPSAPSEGTSLPRAAARVVPVLLKLPPRRSAFAALHPPRPRFFVGAPLLGGDGEVRRPRGVRELRQPSEHGLHRGSVRPVRRVDVLGVDVHESEHVRQLDVAHRRPVVIRRRASTAQVAVVHAEVLPQALQRVDLLPTAAVPLPARHRVVREDVQLALGEKAEHVGAVARKLEQKALLVRVRELHVFVRRLRREVVRDVLERVVRQVHPNPRGALVGVFARRVFRIFRVAADERVSVFGDGARPLGGGHGGGEGAALARFGVAPARGRVGRLEAVPHAHELPEERLELGPVPVRGPRIGVARARKLRRRIGVGGGRGGGGAEREGVDGGVESAVVEVRDREVRERVVEAVVEVDRVGVVRGVAVERAVVRGGSGEEAGRARVGPVGGGREARDAEERSRRAARVERGTVERARSRRGVRRAVRDARGAGAERPRGRGGGHRRDGRDE